LSRGVIGLDFVRFGAAMMVVLYHLAYLSWAKATSSPGAIAGGVADYAVMAPFSAWGWVGVEIFFVISGFVISFSAEKATAFTFFRSRAVRLYPAAWVCASITLLAVLFIAPETQPSLIANYLRSLVLSPIGPWVDGVYWTLGVEIVFYATVFAVLMLGQFPRIPLLFAAMGCASAAFWLAWFLAPGLMGKLPYQFTPLLLLDQGCFFALGGFAWLATKQRLLAWHWLVIAICVAAGLAQITHTAAGLAARVGGAPVWLPAVVWLIGMGAVIASIALAKRAPSARWAGIARSVGLATYPLYLLHDVVGAAIIRLMAFAPWAGLLAAIVLVVAFSFVISTWVEPPLQRWLRGRIDALAARR
jgi:peptidoglycan/LPS O-acetylase OafA/YrhL